MTGVGRKKREEGRSGRRFVTGVGIVGVRGRGFCRGERRRVRGCGSYIGGVEHLMGDVGLFYRRQRGLFKVDVVVVVVYGCVKGADCRLASWRLASRYISLHFASHYISFHIDATVGLQFVLPHLLLSTLRLPPFTLYAPSVGRQLVRTGRQFFRRSHNEAGVAGRISCAWRVRAQGLRCRVQGAGRRVEDFG